MSRALTTATAPLLEAAATAITACAHASAPNVTTSMAPPTAAPVSAAAPDDLEPPELSPVQIVYLRALASGMSITAAAAHASITRRTAYRWHAIPCFAQALHAWRRLSIESARHQLVAMTEQAMAVVSTSLDKSDVRVALALLKGTGILSPKAHEDSPVSAPSAM